MKKYFYLALVCLTSAALFTACNKNGNNSPDQNSLEGQWITNPDQLKDYTPNDSINDCYQFDVWCDGTTIGREYMWTTEAAIIWMIKEAQAAEIRVFGEYHKKYMYTKVEEPTEEACTSRQWEGAECWIETVTYKNENGDLVSEQEYCWWPEKNMRERHDYYMERLEAIGVFNHTYERANINDKDACLAMNPEDTTVIVPPTPDPKDYDKLDSTTNKCWKVTQTMYGISQITYIWTNERALNESFDSVGVPYTYEQAAANDEDACKELQDAENPQGEEACWEVTYTMGGQTQTSHMWCTESAAQKAVSAYNASGYGTASYKASNAADEDACYALDN